MIVDVGTVAKFVSGKYYVSNHSFELGSAPAHAMQK